MDQPEGAATTTSEPGPMSTVDAERYRLALEAGRMGTWYWDVVADRLDWDEQLCQVFGVNRDTFDATFQGYLDLLHPDDVEHTVATIQESLERKQDHYVEHRVLLPDGSVRWISGTGRALLDQHGNVVGMLGVGADITEQRAAQEARLAAEAASEIARTAAERSQARLALLGRVSGVLGASLDVETTLQQVADLVVREGLADWCVVEIPEGDGELSRVALAHRDPEMVEIARRLQARYPPEITTERGVGKVLATGEPEFWPSIPSELLEQSARDSEHLALLRELQLTAAMVVPLTARGRVLGAVSLVRSDGRQFDEEDLRTATDLGLRAAVALDNAYLYADRDRVARTLQQSLLPPVLPEIPGLSMSAIYRAGSQTHGIGGDFYDVFPTGTDQWLVAIGDVCGKGVEAAALTGTVRYAVRTAAVLMSSPALILRAVNETLVQEAWHERFATLQIAQLTIAAGSVGVRMAAGGHPPAILRRSHGQVEWLSPGGPLLGVLPDAEFNEQAVELADRDILLLYTDGVTEAGRAPRLFGEGRLGRAVRESPADAASLAGHVLSSVEEFRRKVVDSLETDHGRDDLALVALQVSSPRAPGVAASGTPQVRSPL